MEHELGIPASCCFRAVPKSWDEAIIQKIASLGHEIGYHYENMSACKGNTGRRWNHAGASIRDREKGWGQAFLIVVIAKGRNNDNKESLTPWARDDL